MEEIPKTATHIAVKLSLSKRKHLANLIFSRLHHANPNPQGELIWQNPYHLLVAVTLSAQATDISVNKATKELFKLITSPQDMIALGENGLISYIKSIGLYRSKATNLIKMAEILIHQHKGEIPETLEELMNLPGVGRKTANVVLNIAFNQPTIAVDTHLFRLAHRMGLSIGNNPLKVEQDLMKIIPDPYLYHAHHWLILHGRYICKARKPNCKNCIVNDICPSYSVLSLEK